MIVDLTKPPIYKTNVGKFREFNYTKHLKHKNDIYNMLFK